jgi:hypothetical protein
MLDTRGYAHVITGYAVFRREGERAKGRNQHSRQDYA